MIPLGNQDMRDIFNPDGTMRMLHSLSSCEYMKIESTNLIVFDRPEQGQTNRKVCVQEQQIDKNGNTYYN